MRLRILAAACVLLASCFSANGEEITYKINTFVVPSPAGPYFYGDYTITLDPTKSYLNETAGLTVDRFSFKVAQRDLGTTDSSGFDYSPSTHTLLIGGLHGGVDALFVNPPYQYPSTPGFINDYLLSVQLSDHPVVNNFVIEVPGVVYRGSTGTITETPLTGVTPEPSSFVLLGTGLLGIAGMLRRRYGN